jgi:competence protein ComEC
MVEAAVAGGRSGAAPGRGARLVGLLAQTLAAEGERRQLWLPVAFGAGIAVYFSLRFEPQLWAAALAAASLFGLAFLCRRRSSLAEAIVLLAVFAAGIAWMRETAREDWAPVLQRRLGPVALDGRVVDIDLAERGWRVVLQPQALPGLAVAEVPALLRVHVPPSSDPLAPGDPVHMLAMLYPPPAPVLPGGRDLERDLYFARIGGVGYSYGGARRLGGAPAAGGWHDALNRLRSDMTARIAAVLPGSTGGVASALITGKRGAIAENVKEAFRESGLSHLLAIAGLHLGLVAAFVFFAVRGGLALVPFLALRWPIKKIAAAVTLAVLFCYLLISGAAIPTERAFVMNGLLLVAILIDRLRLSMRVCAIAAWAVMLAAPDSVPGVSFEMSFGAVVALIAVYETWGAKLGRLLHGRSLPGQVLGYAGGIALTTVVATAGTYPFSIYHFHRLAFYSPLANVIAVPVSAIWTMPWAVVACLLMPFGLEKFALVPMGWGIDLTIRVAEFVSALPGNVWPMPRLPTAGLVAIALGGLWLCLWRGNWRWWGLAAIAAGFMTMALSRPPDLVIADGGRFVAARMADGRYRAAAGREERIDASFLEEETGEPVADWPLPGAAAAPGLACEVSLCRYEARGRKVAIVTEKTDLPLDCTQFDAILAQVPAGFDCRDKIPVVDRIDVWRLGATALWLDPRGVAVKSANTLRGPRPWVPEPHPKPRPAQAAAR